MMDVHIKTKELLKIREYIGRKGEDVHIPLEKGLIFDRIKDVCYISYPDVFRIVVDRLKVHKDYVMFECSEDETNHIYISRSKRALY